MDGELAASTDRETEVVLQPNPGPHIVIFERAGRRSVERRVQLDPSEARLIEVDMEDEGLPRARLDLVSDADVLIEVPGHGEEQGALSLELPAGEYVVLTSVDDAQDQRGVSLEWGEQLRLDLQRPGDGGAGAWPYVGIGAAVAVAAGVLTIVLVSSSADNTGGFPIDDVGT